MFPYLVICAFALLHFSAPVTPLYTRLAPLPSTRLEDHRELEAFRRMSNPSQWRLLRSTRLDFRTFHPQGLLRIGDRFLLSSVEVLKNPEPSSESGPRPRNGIGHLFLFDEHGSLVRDLKIGAGNCFHPGGMDSDGKAAWIPVAEYRPDSTSVVYRLNLDSLTVEEVFRVDDHIGGLVIDKDRIFGLSWGSQRFYTWDKAGRLLKKRENYSGYLEFQDCKHLGSGSAVCSGLNSIEGPTGHRFTLGGLEVVDFNSGVPLVQIPVPLYTPDGTVMTRNPFDFSVNQDSIRLFFVPEDNRSVLYEWEAPLDKK